MLILLIMGYSLPLSSENGYIIYKNGEYNYEIILPQSWKRAVVTLSKKHIMYADRASHTDIKVRAFRSSADDIEKTVLENKWSLRNIDSRLNEIIETERIEIKKNVTGKLLVFEFRSNKKNLLQRTMITINNGIVYIIECKSPLKTFYEYEDIFTIAMASFNYLNGDEQANRFDSEKGGWETKKTGSKELEDLI